VSARIDWRADRALTNRSWGLLYAVRGLRGALICVAVGGRGQLSADRIVWQYRQNTPDTCCPVVYRGLLFTVSDERIANAWMPGLEKTRPAHLVADLISAGFGRLAFSSLTAPARYSSPLLAYAAKMDNKTSRVHVGLNPGSCARRYLEVGSRVFQAPCRRDKLLFSASGCGETRMGRIFPGWILVALTGCIPEDNVDNVVDPEVIPKGRPAAQSPRDKQRLSAVNLNESSWNIVRSPKASPERYRQALDWARQACEMNRRNANLLNTLGVAQYRIGDYQAAEKTLQQAMALRPDSDANKDSAWDRVFLAMTWQQLGKIQQAQRVLEQVRDLISLHQLERNRELQGFMREAQRLIPLRSQRNLNSDETSQTSSGQK